MQDIQFRRYNNIVPSFFSRLSLGQWADQGTGRLRPWHCPPSLQRDVRVHQLIVQGPFPVPQVPITSIDMQTMHRLTHRSFLDLETKTHSFLFLPHIHKFSCYNFTHSYPNRGFIHSYFLCKYCLPKPTHTHRNLGEEKGESLC